MWAAFELERPLILGVLLDAVAKGLAELPCTKLDRLPRMADFALWATACETALWPSGTFWSAYCGNRDEAVDGVIDADPIASAVRAVMTTRTEWTGTASELLGALAETAGERIAKAKTWPDSGLPAQNRHRHQLRPRGPGADADDQPNRRFKSSRDGNPRGTTVRTVRTARSSLGLQSGQQLGDARSADGR